jgi:hypothetical protein
MRGTEPLDVVVPPARHLQLGIDIASIRPMHAGQPVALLQVVVDRGAPLPVRHGRRRRLDVRDQVWAVRVAGLGEVHFVAHPRGRPLPTRAGVGIVGGGDVLRGRRDARAPAPARDPVS